MTVQPFAGGKWAYDDTIDSHQTGRVASDQSRKSRKRHWSGHTEIIYMNYEKIIFAGFEYPKNIIINFGNTISAKEVVSR